MQVLPQFANWSKERPKRRTVKLEESIEVWHAHFYPIASGPNRLIDEEMLQDLQSQMAPPLLLGRVYPARCPEVSRWIITFGLNEKVQEGSSHCWVLPHWYVLANITRMQAEYMPRMSRPAATVRLQDANVH